MHGHEHHDDNEVNVPENAVYKENQVISQMEQNVAPSDADIGLSDNCLALGTEFPDIDALRNALSDMAVMTGREYKHVRTSPSKLSMKCKAEDCKWSIEATRSSDSSPFKVVKYQEAHTCMVRTNSGDKDHPQATVRWIVSKMQSSIEKDPEIEPRKIVKEIKNQFGIKISYNKAVKAKKRVEDVMRTGHDPLPCLVKELEQSGNVAKVDIGSDSSQYFFWSFRACIDALHNHLRPVVYVASMNTEAGVLMFARGIDGDSDLIDVGFGFYDYDTFEEDEKLAWERYLGWLKEFVLPPTTAAAAAAEGVPFSIVTDFEETGALSGAVENVLPHLHHFFHPHSVRDYFSNKFGDYSLYRLCYLAFTSFSKEKHESYLQEIKATNEEAYWWLLSSSVGSKSQWAIAFSPNKHLPNIEEDLLIWGFESMREKRSIVEIVESSREEVAYYFSERRREGEEAAKTTTGLTPGVTREIESAELSEVESIDGRKYRIRFRYSYSYKHAEEVVDLKEKSCTCGEFQAYKYPCDHAFWAIAHLDLDVRNYFNHRWYSLDTYRATYAGILPPPIPDHILEGDTPIAGLPPKRRKVGRPRKFQAKCLKTV